MSTDTVLADSADKATGKCCYSCGHAIAGKHAEFYVFAKSALGVYVSRKAEFHMRFRELTDLEASIEAILHMPMWKRINEQWESFNSNGAPFKDKVASEVPLSLYIDKGVAVCAAPFCMPDGEVASMKEGFGTRLGTDVLPIKYTELIALQGFVASQHAMYEAYKREQQEKQEKGPSPDVAPFAQFIAAQVGKASLGNLENLCFDDIGVVPESKKPVSAWGLLQLAAGQGVYSPRVPAAYSCVLVSTHTPLFHAIMNKCTLQSKHSPPVLARPHMGPYTPLIRQQLAFGGAERVEGVLIQAVHNIEDAHNERAFVDASLKLALPVIHEKEYFVSFNAKDLVDYVLDGLLTQTRQEQSHVFEGLCL